MSKEYKCVHCGAVVWRIPSAIRGDIFCSRACCAAYRVGKPSKRRPMVGSDASKWKGGNYISADGYRHIWKPGHPNANKAGYVAEHRLVMAYFLKRPLSTGEVVHHKNGDKLDNRLKNLELTNASDHMKIHVRRFDWSERYGACVSCGGTEQKHCAKGLCYRCYGRVKTAEYRNNGYIVPSRRKKQAS